jgi:hypothetical protein
MKIATLVLAATLLVPAATLFSEPSQRDVPAEVDSARNALKGAFNDLEHAGDDWGGHRASASFLLPNAPMGKAFEECSCKSMVHPS